MSDFRQILDIERNIYEGFHKICSSYLPIDVIFLRSTLPQHSFPHFFQRVYSGEYDMREESKLFYELINLPKSSLRSLVRRLFSNGFDPGRLDIIEFELFKSRYRDKYSHASKWMESRLVKTPDITPLKLALAYISVTSGNKKLLPYYIRLARKVKDRVRKRNSKALQVVEVAK